MFTLNWEVRLGKYKLGILDSIELTKSVDSLSNTATIKLPAKANQELLTIAGEIKIRDKVLIKLGYEGNLETEFEGYITDISNTIGSDKNAASIVISCEDDMYLYRTSFTAKTFEKTSNLVDVIRYLISQVNSGHTMIIDPTASFKYENYVLSGATAYEELKKIKDESKWNIYIKDKSLYVLPPYKTAKESAGSFKYDYSVNIEKATLDYKLADDRKFYVEVKGNKKTVSNNAGNSSDKSDNTVMPQYAGDPKGSKISIQLSGIQDAQSLKQVADAEFKRLSYTGYSGTFVGWLIPFVQPGDIVEINDSEFKDRNSSYFISAVKTEFSKAGGIRTITISGPREIVTTTSLS